MEYRFFGRTGIKISALCFGTMPFGSLSDEESSAAMFRRCREAGINFFDCADVYSQGRAEEILGKLTADCRDEVVIASKVYFPTSKDVNAVGLSRYHIRNAVEASLRRLGTDRIDVYFIHRFDDYMDLEDVFRSLDDLVSAGKILHPALSNVAAWQAAKALGTCAVHGWAPPVCTQPMYNLVKRQAEVEILPHAASENLAVLPYGPLGGGLLSGKYGIKERPLAGRLVENKMYQTRYGDTAYYEIAESFTQFAKERGYHPAALAIAWVAGHPAVTAPIVGARDLTQLETVLSALDISMTESFRAEISALSPAPPPATDRNEEASENNYGSR